MQRVWPEGDGAQRSAARMVGSREVAFEQKLAVTRNQDGMDIPDSLFLDQTIEPGRQVGREARRLGRLRPPGRGLGRRDRRRHEHRSKRGKEKPTVWRRDCHGRCASTAACAAPLHQKSRPAVRNLRTEVSQGRRHSLISGASAPATGSMPGNGTAATARRAASLPISPGRFWSKQPLRG